MDGVIGKDVDVKSLPPGANALKGLGNIGSWRGHLNAIHHIVTQGYQSALIVEDDVDWDVRLKDQLSQFAEGIHLLEDARMTDAKPSSLYVDPRNLLTARDAANPYGNGWDLLWLGHCGTRFPEEHRDPGVSQTRAVLLDDVTVPETQHLAFDWGSNQLELGYPNHTRVIHHTAENVCSLAYAVTQRTARQLLWKLSLDRLTGPIDVALRNYCDRGDEGPIRNCYTAQPAYFEHHRPSGSTSRFSDINEDVNPKHNPQPYTNNIRLSVRLNLGRLTDGKTDLLDQFPDTR